MAENISGKGLHFHVNEIIPENSKHVEQMLKSVEVKCQIGICHNFDQTCVTLTIRC